MSAPSGHARFVILCLGRSGSTHLQSLLDSHPDVRCFGELFSDRVPSGSAGFIHSSHDDVTAYFGDLVASVEEPVVGFKLPMNSIRAQPAAADLLRGDPAIRVIRLSRRNLLAQLVSRRLLAATQVPQSIYGDYGDTTVRIEPGHCLRAFERMDADEDELDELAEGRPTERITYEELIEGQGIEGLQRFLGLEPRPLTSWFEKMRTRPLSETVENWAELAEELRGTRYAGFLTDGS